MRKRCLSKILLTTLGVLLAMFLLPRGEVNVKGASANSGDGVTTYRALLIGEEAFDPICTRNRSDVLMMKELLQYRNLFRAGLLRQGARHLQGLG